MGLRTFISGLPYILGLVTFSQQQIDRHTGNRAKIATLLIKLKKASLETRHFIEAKGYERNTDLRDLWFDAFEAANHVKHYTEENLPDLLFRKAEFWDATERWLTMPASLSLVPKLRQIEDECESLLVKLNR